MPTYSRARHTKKWTKARLHTAQKGARARGRDGDQLQHTPWEKGILPGDHLPPGMAMELEAGIAGASLKQGLAKAKTVCCHGQRLWADPGEAFMCPHRLFLWHHATFLPLILVVAISQHSRFLFFCKSLRGAPETGLRTKDWIYVYCLFKDQ